MTHEAKAAKMFNTIKQGIKKLPLSAQMTVVTADNWDKLPEVAQVMLTGVVEQMEKDDACVPRISSISGTAHPHFFLTRRASRICRLQFTRRS